MKMRWGKSLLVLTLLIVVVILLWQIHLIVSTLRREENGKDLSDLLSTMKTRTKAKGEREASIPSRIHQMWKTTNVSTYPIGSSMQQWKSSFPTYEYFFWTDASIAQLIDEPEYRHLTSIYFSFPYPIQRSDLARLLILHRHGGLYADLDVFPHSVDRLESLRRSNVSLIISRSTNGFSLINHILLAERSSPILSFVLQQYRRTDWSERIFLLPYVQVFATGSIFLTETIHRWIRTEAPQSPSTLTVLSDDEMRLHVVHEQGRSWHLIDGFLLNWIEDHGIFSSPTRLVVFVLVLVLLLAVGLFVFSGRPSFYSSRKNNSVG